MMLTLEFLRNQAENCLRIARTCFDLSSAERLRLMAAELNAKAAEMEENDRPDRRPRGMQRHRSSQHGCRHSHIRQSPPCEASIALREDDMPRRITAFRVVRLRKDRATNRRAG
jgi:hypothetical protein